MDEKTLYLLKSEIISIYGSLFLTLFVIIIIVASFTQEDNKKNKSCILKKMSLITVLSLIFCSQFYFFKKNASNISEDLNSFEEIVNLLDGKKISSKKIPLLSTNTIKHIQIKMSREERMSYKLVIAYILQDGKLTVQERNTFYKSLTAATNSKDEKISDEVFKKKVKIENILKSSFEPIPKSKKAN